MWLIPSLYYQRFKCYPRRTDVKCFRFEINEMPWIKVHHHLFLASAKRAEQIQCNMTPPIKTDIMVENVILPLSLLSSWRYVFISQKAYQESETRPESSVYTLMKGSAIHGDEILDTVEYAQPSEVISSLNLCCIAHAWVNHFKSFFSPFCLGWRCD